MKRTGRRSIDFENGVLLPVGAEVVSRVLAPAVQNSFVSMVIIAPAEHHHVLDPDQGIHEGKPTVLERADKEGQQLPEGTAA